MIEIVHITMLTAAAASVIPITVKSDVNSIGASISKRFTYPSPKNSIRRAIIAIDMRFSISNRKVIVALAVILMAMAIGGHAQSNPAPEIRVTAEKYEFKPDTITVKRGDHVKLVITALDHDHGFKIEAFHINQKLRKGDPVTLEFSADQAGTFPFECSHFCGLGHGKMKGTLVVE